MAVSATTENWNHGTAGPARYVVWMMPLIFDSLVRQNVLRGGRWMTGRLYATMLAIAITVQAAVVFLEGGLSPDETTYLYHSRAAAFVLDHFPAAYQPSPNIFP